MGVYLNNKSAFGLFRKTRFARYYVDKSDILSELIECLETSDNAFNESDAGIDSRYICITRPRRFGKTTMANMIASYFGKGVDSHAHFNTLNVSKYDWYEKHINKHNVICITFSELSDKANYASYITRFKRGVLSDLIKAYPDVDFDDSDELWDALTKIYEYENEQFIFVFDEWDYIYHQDFISKEDKNNFTKFLSTLLKDKAYVELVYMTGILPIAKYSSGSELNMFAQYTMINVEKFSTYFGFSDKEVDDLYNRYLKIEKNPRVTREGLRLWYDGYNTLLKEKLYNPRSVVCALSDNQLSSYWTSSGPYDELFYYIGANVDSVKDDVALLLSDIPVPANVMEYAATSMKLNTRDEIFSAMVVYGFLNYDDGYISIPNKELKDKFAEMAAKEESLGTVYNLVKESERMLYATKAGDTETMKRLLNFTHNTERAILQYNSEAELTVIVTLLYLKARDYYRIEREDKAGLGFVDFIFYPNKRDDDAIIIELKVNDTSDNAISQIKKKGYALKFEGKIGEEREYKGRILAVGISYKKDDREKKHDVKVEVLRERL